MQRRIYFLGDTTINAVRNRSIDVGEKFRAKRWQCMAGMGHFQLRYDVLWVLDPILACKIGQAQYRLLVWDRRIELPSDGDEGMRRMAGEFILKHCANLILTPNGHELYSREAQGLDCILIMELGDEVLEVVGGAEGATT